MVFWEPSTRAHREQCFFFDGHEPHDKLYPSSAPPFAHLWLKLAGGRVIAGMIIKHRKQQDSTPMEPPPFAVSSFEAYHVLATCWDEVKQRAGLPLEFVRMRMIAAVSSVLAEFIQDGYGAAPTQDETFQDKVLDTVRKYIENTSGQGLSLATLAHLSGYSKSHFIRLFQNRYHCSAHEYIERCRIMTARKMLAQGYPKKDISDRLGFSCPASFSRWLRGRRL